MSIKKLNVPIPRFKSKVPLPVGGIFENDLVVKSMIVKNIKKNGELVNSVKLSELFGTPTSVILTWRKAGMPSVKTSHGLRFNTADCLNWRVLEQDKLVRDELTPLIPDNEMTFTQAKTRKECAEALMSELKLAKARSELANIDDLMDEFSHLLTVLRSKLVSMSSRLSGILSHHDETDISEMLDREVADMLEGFVKYER